LKTTLTTWKRIGLLSILAAVFCGFAPSSATANDNEQDPPEKPYGMMTVESADEDFLFQGEFVGQIANGKQKQDVGLQIVALGDGKFSATQYTGGLPGDGWNGKLPIRMAGTRTDKVLVLSGSDLALLSKREHCVVVDAEGRRVGNLKRVHRVSPTMGAQPARGAMVIFDGSNTDQFSIGEMTENGLLMQGSDFKPMFQDFNLHLEFQLSYMPKNGSQQRSNSGLYLQSRYEVQVLDSFGQDPLINGCGSLYRTQAPDLNMCLPPLSWQTYDIVFTSPRFAADGSKTRNAHITVWLNGVRIHHNFELKNKTGAGKPEEPFLLPIRLQNHQDQVRYRNIWIVDRGLVAPKRFPIMPKSVLEKKRQKPQPKPVKSKAKSAVK
jgi:hypothetical protein